MDDPRIGPGRDGTAEDIEPLRPLILILRRRWSPAILAVLSAAPTHYLELYRRLPGIAQKVLTEHLRLLEREGFVWRHAGKSNRVHYGLTPRGASLWRLMVVLRDWVAEEDDSRESA